MTHGSAIYPSLEGKVVFVTGGGSGIGAAIVTGFVRQKALVGFVDIDEPASTRLLRDLEGTGPPPRFIRCDVRDIDALRTAIGTVQAELCDIGVLVNNSSRDDRHAIESVTLQYWDERAATYFRQQFLPTQEVIEQMKRLGGGSIINFRYLAWMMASVGKRAQATSKAAVHDRRRGC